MNDVKMKDVSKEVANKMKYCKRLPLVPSDESWSLYTSLLPGPW